MKLGNHSLIFIKSEFLHRVAQMSYQVFQKIRKFIELIAWKLYNLLLSVIKLVVGNDYLNFFFRNGVQI